MYCNLRHFTEKPHIHYLPKHSLAGINNKDIPADSRKTLVFFGTSEAYHNQAFLLLAQQDIKKNISAN